jgi:hypothetical protein
MKQFWPWNTLQVLKDICQMHYIMAIDRSEVPEIHPFKEIAAVEYGTFKPASSCFASVLALGPILPNRPSVFHTLFLNLL